jgi:ElaB/YqjD/DUF883 family membrane-anchored ribosome-binding protein
MQRKSATSGTILDSYELAQQLADIREDLQGLTSMVGRIVNTQVGRAKDAAVDTGTRAQEAIKQNPILALAIAVGLGFLFGIFMMRR